MKHRRQKEKVWITMIKHDPIGNLMSTKERKEIRDRKIRALYRIYRNMDRVVLEMMSLGMGVSKTTVFFAINGRSKKRKSDGGKLKK